MLVFIELFIRFFVIGICAFGGGLATIPFLTELAEGTSWFTGEALNWYTIQELSDMIAVSESTPGAIGINMSTYVGYQAAVTEFNGNAFMGFIGGISATMGLVSPSIIVILIISKFLEKFKNAKIVKWVFYGLRAASIGLICAAAFSILELSIIDTEAFVHAFDGINSSNFFKDIWYAISNGLIALFGDFKALSLAIFMGIIIFKYKKHPIMYIVIAAIIGIIFQM